MNKISIITMLSAILLSTNSSIILASAAAGSEQEKVTQARALQQEGKLSLALDKLVESGPTQDSSVITVINELGETVYNSAMFGTGGFDKETGDVYLKRHAGLWPNGLAQSYLNAIALSSTRRYTDATGRQYLMDRFVNHNDADAGMRLNTAAINCLRGFTEQTGLEYLEQQITKLEQISAESTEKQAVISTVAQHAIDTFTEQKYVPTLPKGEFTSGWEQSGNNPPKATIYARTFPTDYPEKKLFMQHAPKLFIKAQNQHIADLYKEGEAKMKRELGLK